MKPYEEFDIELLSATTAQQLANIINAFHDSGGGFHVWTPFPFPFMSDVFDVFIKGVIVRNDNFDNKLNSIIGKLPENIIHNIKNEYGDWIRVYGSYKGFILFTTDTVPPIVVRIVPVSNYT